MMKKILMMLIGIIILTGCSAGSGNINVQIVEEPTYAQGQTSKVSFAITNGEEAVEGVNVSVLFEMAKMDHGSIEINLEEEGKGIYSADVELPMAGEWQAIVTVSGEGIDAEKVIDFTAVEGTKITAADLGGGVLATINGDEIVQSDLDFYQFINKLQIEMYREKDKQNYKGAELEEAMKYWDAQEEATKHPNTLITQIIRLRAIALLSEEKGHTVTKEEIQAEIDKVRATYEQSPAASAMIKEYGEEKFWSTQEQQYELIVLSSKVQQDVLNNVKKENPNAESKEVNMLAQKKYEELLVSQVSTLDIKINNQL
ncbi:FixH family protein [Bacillus sp. Marseille-P3661]|uniref:FixH family protein n=1 Tax=Bacillus sp. Marseille-P3661 TaxID=1936234 RepID=UPI002155ABEB|nr:FixH family protein [Bacillus sp. Marseille-P3661]